MNEDLGNDDSASLGENNEVAESSSQLFGNFNVKDLVGLKYVEGPAKLLIEKMSNGFGNFSRPFGTFFNALANAKSNEISASSGIKISGMTDRQNQVLEHALQKEDKKLKNTASIIAKAIPFLREGAEPDKIDDDFVADFNCKSENVSDVRMQQLWAKILAGEANAPGKFSKRTMSFISNMSLNEAETFNNLAQFSVTNRSGNNTIIVSNHRIHFYKKSGISYTSIFDLEAIGLIIFLPNANAAINIEPPVNTLQLWYGDHCFSFVKKNGGMAISRFIVGEIILTKLGQQLINLCDHHVNDDFIDCLKTTFASQNGLSCEVTKMPNIPQSSTL